MTEKLPEEAVKLSDKQKEYLQRVIDLISRINDADKLQIALYNLSQELNLDSNKAFTAIYTAFLGKKHGPKAAWFLLHYDKDQIIHRLKEASQEEVEKESSFATIKSISRSSLFSIERKVKEMYPSVSVGIALIKNVTIARRDAVLEKEKEKFLANLKGLTTEQLGQYREIQSYRKLYKEMGIDWHSRRPSPEALLRRVVLGKGLYSINTCVDAYNLVVMKQKVSVGAFDFDRLKFPTILRFAKEGDEILLLGDEEPTKYTSKELAYYDKEGGYNIDFNYRDAKRTMVTVDTTNIWINVDGIFDITPQRVWETLHEAVINIVEYAGGKVEFEGVVV